MGPAGSSDSHPTSWEAVRAPAPALGPGLALPSCKRLPVVCLTLGCVCLRLTESLSFPESEPWAILPLPSHTPAPASAYPSWTDVHLCVDQLVVQPSQ